MIQAFKLIGEPPLKSKSFTELCYNIIVDLITVFFGVR